MLLISEVFGPTVQGEGKRAGNPSIFIRLAKCNMKCSGFGVKYEAKNGEIKLGCDSFYAVDGAFKKQWKKQTAKDIIKQIDKMMPNYKVDIVITGGEPLLYWEDKEFKKILKYYNKKNNPITIETNGTIKLDFDHKYQKKVLFSIGLKLSNSDEPLNKRINSEALKSIIRKKGKNSYLKFVIDKKNLTSTELEINQIIKKIPKCDIYLMPLGNNYEVLQYNCQATIDLALKYGYKYSDRAQIRAWDNKRGI